MNRRQRGFTLIELVISMVVIAIAVAGVLLPFQFLVARSADPMIRTQALAIAEAYLEEVSLKPVADPDGGNEASRALYDDISDYDGLNGPVRDQEGNSVGLDDYTAAVTVSAANDLGIGGGNELRITVTVSHQGQAVVSLTGYRTNYW